jgi:hypothetical protein
MCTGDGSASFRSSVFNSRCREHQLRGVRTARYAIGMRLMMRIVEWLEPPSAFIHAARW